MNEQIIIEKCIFENDQKVAKFKHINLLLNECWTIKDWKLEITTKPTTHTVVAVLQHSN